MAIFGPKPWVNPFGKISVFRVFELFVFIAQKGVFFFQNFVKDIFLAYIAQKKKSEKWPILDQNHGLNPLEKCQFFNLLNFLFLQARKAFFCSKISSKAFSWPILSKTKSLKMAIFGPKPWFNRFGKMSIFRPFNFLFLQARNAFFVAEYR